MNDCPSDDQLADLISAEDGTAGREHIEDHIGECEQCQRRLEALALDKTEADGWHDRLQDRSISWPTGPHVAVDDSDPKKWPTVPGHEILGVLGRGGMGVVYKARHSRLGRVVALKTLLVSHAQSAEQRRRFKHEAEALARLRHPNIVQIYEVIEHGEAVYLALEYVEGGSLSQRLKDSTLRASEAAALLARLAHAMQSAHDVGILHRDLKPANVLLSGPPGKRELPVPKISDFGLARRMTATTQTKIGDIIGTPSYLAPEQALGTPGWSKPAVDVYGLGAILYECLAGKPPFRADSVHETVRQVIHEEPAPPSRLQPGVPRDLVTVCLKCLAKEPKKRYRSCAELAEDLERFAAGRPIRARRVSWWERFRKWAGRHPMIALLGGLLVLTLVSLLGVWVRHTYDLGRLNAELREETRRANENEAEAIRGRNTAEIAKRQALVAASQMTLSFQQQCEALYAQLGTGGDESDRAILRALRESLEVFARANERLNYDESRLQLARNYHWIGLMMGTIGEPARQAHYLQQAAKSREMIEVSRGRDPDACPELGLYLLHAGRARPSAGRAGAETTLRRAVRILDGAPDPESAVSYRPFWRAAARYHLAETLHPERRDEAVNLLREARSLLDGAGEPEPAADFAKLRSAIERELR